MPYGEPQLQSWEVGYQATFLHEAGGYVQVTSGVNDDPVREAKADAAMQALIDVLLANGFVQDGTAYKTCQSAQAITPTPVE